jgi:hypothetical protein
MVRAFLLVIGFVALAAAASAARAETIVLVDVPVAVESALRTSLAPWGVEVVVAPAPAVFDPPALARARDASFVAWQRGGELIVYDVAAASEQRRPSPAAPDDTEAAAIALSIKTWMGLGAPPGEVVVLCGPLECPPPPRPRERRWIAEALLGVRADIAHQGGADLRYGLAGGARLGRYEAGLRIDRGIDRDGIGFAQEGAWAVTGVSVWGRAAIAASPTIAIVPGAGIGLLHTSFTSVRAMPGAHAEEGSTNGFALDAEVGVRWRRGRVSAGARIGLTAVPRTQVLESRNLAETVEPHVEPWLLATMSVGL